MSKVFRHDIIDLPAIERIDGEIRYYRTPTGTYPSATSVLDKTTDKTGLDIWRGRVGAEEASRIAAKAARRGTIVHGLCEKLVLNEEVDLKKEMPINKHLYKQIEKFLIRHCDNIRGSESYLYSDLLRIAGSCDLIADWNGVPSIIDFKTSFKNKNKEWIENYFLQCSMYSYMLWERTQLLHSQIVIIIAVEDENEAQVFTEQAKNYLKKAKSLCEMFHNSLTSIL